MFCYDILVLPQDPSYQFKDIKQLIMGMLETYNYEEVYYYISVLCLYCIDRQSIFYTYFIINFVCVDFTEDYQSYPDTWRQKIPGSPSLIGPARSFSKQPPLHHL